MDRKKRQAIILSLFAFAFYSSYLSGHYYQPLNLESSKKVEVINNTKGTCSAKSDLRGPHQKVISYSVYGNLKDPNIIKRYIEPIIDNINNIHHLYPGWAVRVYHNFSNVDPVELETFFKVNYQVDLCNATQIIKDLNLGDVIIARTWRWLALFDDLVDVMISRDSDSYIYEREVGAVQEWMNSKQQHTFHIMRDHPAHCSYDILGGMWGVKLHQNRTILRKAAEQVFDGTLHNNTGYNFDQQLLTRFMWPMAQFDSMSHDSYCCNQRNFTRPFPTKRKWKEFVGRVNRPTPYLESAHDYVACPLKCRGSSDWIYC